MTGLVKRAGKGSPLSATDHDNNVQWLSHGAINVKAFGAVGDDATDDYDAIMAAIDAAIAADMAPIYFPPGTYYVSQTIRIKSPARLIGSGTGMFGSAATTLRFPIDVRGVHLEFRETWADKMQFRFETNAEILAGVPTYFGEALTYSPSSPAEPFAETGAHLVAVDGSYYLVAASDAVDHTHTTSGGVKLYQQGGEVDVPPLGTAQGASIENMVLKGGGGTDREAHGIKAQTRFLVIGVFCQYFAGDGIHIVASADGAGRPGAIYGNANVWRLRTVTCYQNGRDGLYVQGADANAGNAIECDLMLNSRFGLNERSFLGNTYFGCHSDGNGTPGNMPGLTGGNSADQTSIVTVSGLRYTAHPLATEEQLRTTSPTDQTAVLPALDADGLPASMPVWIHVGSAGTGYAREWAEDQPVGTYINGGNYISMSATQQNTFVGCYEEAGGGGHFIGGRNVFIGGFLSETMSGNSVYADSGNKLEVGEVRTKGVADGRYASLGWGSSGEFLSFTHDVSVEPFRLKYNWNSDGNYQLDQANTNSRTAFYLTGPNTTSQFGTGAPVPYLFGAPNLGVGSRRHTSGTAAPTTGAWAQGDIVWNEAPSAAGTVGWVCVTAGTPGTWKTFGAIAS